MSPGRREREVPRLPSDKRARGPRSTVRPARAPTAAPRPRGRCQPVHSSLPYPLACPRSGVHWPGRGRAGLEAPRRRGGRGPMRRGNEHKGGAACARSPLPLIPPPSPPPSHPALPLQLTFGRVQGLARIRDQQGGQVIVLEKVRLQAGGGHFFRQRARRARKKKRERESALRRPHRPVPHTVHFLFCPGPRAPHSPHTPTHTRTNGGVWRGPARRCVT